MGVITAIQSQHRPGRYNISVDGNFTIAVSEKVLLDLNLAVGAELDEHQLTETSAAEDAHKALSAAYRLLESRARSQSEIASRLTQHGYSLETIDAVVSRLHQNGLIDDVNFTSAWIESRSRSQPAGKYKLRSELSLKGVAKETIDEAVGQITEDDEQCLARKALLKRPAVKSDDTQERRAAYARDAAFLARRGFNWSIAKPALDERYAGLQHDPEV